jgi:hypothetical protein
MATSKKKSNRFMFTGEFSHFKTKNNDFGEDSYGLVLTNIKKTSSKKKISDSQWFHLGDGFKKTFDKHKDDELPGKTIKFEAALESNKKEYYTYRDNILISGPEDLEHRLLRPTKIKVLD